MSIRIGIAGCGSHAMGRIVPQIAANPPHATTVPIATPPGKCPIQAVAARNNSRLSPVALTSAPMSTNIGMTLKLKSVTVRIGSRYRGSAPA